MYNKIIYNIILIYILEGSSYLIDNFLKYRYKRLKSYFLEKKKKKQAYMGERVKQLKENVFSSSEPCSRDIRGSTRTGRGYGAGVTAASPPPWCWPPTPNRCSNAASPSRLSPPGSITVIYLSWDGIEFHIFLTDRSFLQP